MPPRVAIIAALEREIAPLVKGFRRETPSDTFRTLFSHEQISVVCGGIGSKAPVGAAQWLIDRTRPELIVSAGFAGALVPGRKVGDVITPGTVIDAMSGERFFIPSGSGILVTTPIVASESQKRELATEHGAVAVDMEAAAVARVAHAKGVPFVAVKVISDEAGFPMLPMDRFIDGMGKFHTSELLGYVAVRPWLWPAVVQLGKNARKASSQLCDWLMNQISRDFEDILEGVERPALS